MFFELETCEIAALKVRKHLIISNIMCSAKLRLGGRSVRVFCFFALLLTSCHKITRHPSPSLTREGTTSASCCSFDRSFGDSREDCGESDSTSDLPAPTPNGCEEHLLSDRFSESPPA